MKKNTLFHLERSHGKYVSGTAIAQACGCSRMAVSKAVAELRAEGAVIESSTKCGYKLTKSTDTTYPCSIKAYLSDEYTADVYTHPSIVSTNDEAKRLASGGAAHGTIISADTQSGGRGRRGNRFHSPDRSGIYMSVIIKPQLGRTDVLYTVAAAVAVRRVLDRYSEQNAEIKWVNDIYISDRKVCGILCEAVTELESGEITAVICGIGVNLTPPSGGFPDDIKNKAGYVSEKSISKAKVIAEIAQELLLVLTLDNTEVMIEYSSNMMLISRNIYYREGEELKNAKVLSVDMTGGLVVCDSEKNIKTLRSGEVHLEKF